jgi:hypothetical protein
VLKLMPGQSLRAGQKLTWSGYEVTLQTDGNFVLYHAGGPAIWDAGTQGSGATTVTMQTDGNLVIYAGTHAVWDANTQGHPGAYLALQDDGNMVVYAGTTALWQSDTMGGVKHEHKSWLAKAVSTTLNAPSSLAKSIAHDVEKIVPDAKKFFVKITQSPYWKVVAGAAIFIPGVGIGISAGMAAATAIGKASSLKDALINTAREAIPGDIGKAGFDAANGVLLQGQPIDQAALAVVRKQAESLGPVGAAGFDAAIALHTGRYAQIKAPLTMTSPAAKVGFYTAQGLRGAPADIQQNVHAIVVAPTAATKSGFGVGVQAAAKEQQSEQAQLLLAQMRELMKRVRAGDPAAKAQVDAITAKADAGDAKAKAAVQMLAIADRANREINHNGGSLLEIGGLPLLTLLRKGASTFATFALLPFGWIKETFFDDHHHKAA